MTPPPSTILFPLAMSHHLQQVRVVRSRALARTLARSSPTSTSARALPAPSRRRSGPRARQDCAFVCTTSTETSTSSPSSSVSCAPRALSRAHCTRRSPPLLVGAPNPHPHPHPNPSAPCARSRDASARRGESEPATSTTTSTATSHVPECEASQSPSRPCDQRFTARAGTLLVRLPLHDFSVLNVMRND